MPTYSFKIPVTEEFAKDLEINQELQKILISDFISNFQKEWESFLDSEVNKIANIPLSEPVIENDQS